jgi:hypothetical protein
MHTFTVSVSSSSAIDDPSQHGQPASAGLQLSIQRCSAEYLTCAPAL